MTVGECIKQIRKEKGLTQKALGEKCIPKISESNIRKYENGKQNPKIETIGRIAQALEVSVFSLLPSGKMPESQFNDCFGDLIRQSNDLHTKTNLFHNYLLSLGYEIYESPYNEKWTIHILESDSEIYLTDEEMKILEHSTKENVDLRISSYLHDGNHMQ